MKLDDLENAVEAAELVNWDVTLTKIYDLIKLIKLARAVEAYLEARGTGNEDVFGELMSIALDELEK